MIETRHQTAALEKLSKMYGSYTRPGQDVISEDFLSEVLTDLMHFAKVYAVDMGKAQRIAEFNFKVESTT